FGPGVGELCDTRERRPRSGATLAGGRTYHLEQDRSQRSLRRESPEGVGGARRAGLSFLGASGSETSRRREGAIDRGAEGDRVRPLACIQSHSAVAAESVLGGPRAGDLESGEAGARGHREVRANACGVEGKGRLRHSIVPLKGSASLEEGEARGAFRVRCQADGVANGCDAWRFGPPERSTSGGS